MNFVKLLKFAKVCGVITLLKALWFCFVGRGSCIFALLLYFLCFYCEFDNWFFRV